MTDHTHISFDPIPRIDDWRVLPEIPTGTRKKMVVDDPETGRYNIFKYPKERREHQLWSELLASHIAGDLLGWQVQHASIAERGGRLGNLLGYVYEPWTDAGREEALEEGWILCQAVDPLFDVDKGTRHTLPLLARIHDELIDRDPFWMDPDEFYDFRARTLAFDTLISNTDRHAENWAVILGPEGARMAALYDNGSSLGCGLDHVGLRRAFDESGRLKKSHLDRQRARGRHHLRVDGPAKHGGLFEDVCGRFLEIYPAGRHRFETAEAVDVEAVCDLMDTIGATASVQEPHCLSEERRIHMHSMLALGVERIRNVLS